MIFQSGISSNKYIIKFYKNVLIFNIKLLFSFKLLINIFNFLTASFRTLHCLISKPVFVVTPDKVEIQLFYYFLDPKKNLKKEKWVLGGSYKRAQVPTILNTNVENGNPEYKDKINSRLVKFHFKIIKIKDNTVETKV